MSAHLARGQRLVELKRYAEAAREFITASAIPGNEVHALALGSGSLALSGDLKGARELLRQARQLDPDDDAVIMTDSSIQMLGGRPDSARLCMRRLLAKHPLDVDLLAAASCLENACDNRAGALAHAERGLALDPNHEDCLEALLGALSPQSPELPEAIRRLLACSPENALAHLALATVAHAGDRLADADAHLGAALRLDPNLSAAHALRARIAATRHPLYQFLAEGRLGRHSVALGWRIAGLFLPMLVWFLCFAIFFADKASAAAGPPLLARWLSVASMPQTLLVTWVVTVLFWHSAHVLAYTVTRHPLRLFLRYSMIDTILPACFGLVAVLSIAAYIATNDVPFFGLACLAPLTWGSLAMALQRTQPSARTSALLATVMLAAGIIATFLGRFSDFPAGTVLWTLVLINIALWCLLTPKPLPAATTPTPPPLPSS